MSDKSWKAHMSAFMSQLHEECDFKSFFISSKLVQKLLCMEVQANVQYSATNTDAISVEGGDDVISTKSSGTETMEYEDIDRLFSIDSITVIKGLTASPTSGRCQETASALHCTTNQQAATRVSRLSSSPVKWPLSSQQSGTGFSALRMRRKYVKRNKTRMKAKTAKVGGESVATKTKKRVVKILGQSMLAC